MDCQSWSCFLSEKTVPWLFLSSTCLTFCIPLHCVCFVLCCVAWWGIKVIHACHLTNLLLVGKVPWDKNPNPILKAEINTHTHTPLNDDCNDNYEDNNDTDHITNDVDERYAHTPTHLLLSLFAYSYSLFLLFILSPQDIEVVINYDFPVGSSGLENYVHRIGRTARGNATGNNWINSN